MRILTGRGSFPLVLSAALALPLAACGESADRVAAKQTRATSEATPSGATPGALTTTAVPAVAAPTQAPATKAPVTKAPIRTSPVTTAPAPVRTATKRPVATPPAPKATVAKPPPAPPAPAGTTLSQGSRGPAVTALQSRLAALRYDVGAIDGYYGYDTYHAVVAFQKTHGMSRTGVATPAVVAAGNRSGVVGMGVSRAGRYVEVNLSQQVLKVGNGGSVVRIFDVSTGRPSMPTRTGSFTIYKRVDGWHDAGLGTVFRPNYFYGAYSIHAYSSVPSYPASHGCVRVTNPGMGRLWGQLFVGMPVVIHY